MPAVFASAASPWIVPGLLSEIPAVADALPWLGGLDDTAIAIVAGLVLFALPAERGGRMVLVRDDAQKGLRWGVLLLLGGGLSLAAAVVALVLLTEVTSNAIVFGSGTVSIARMARGGAVLDVVGVVLIALFAFLLGGWALGLQF